MAIEHMATVMRPWIALSMLVVVAGCGVDPLPEPPSGPELVGEFHGSTCTVCDGQGKLAGGPGSVKDADTLWVVDLDNTTPPVVAAVESDGSFELFLFAIEGDELRLQARQGSARSIPIDLVMALDGILEPPLRPLANCFVVEPELALPATAVGSSAPATVRIEHDCQAPLSIDLITMRSATPDFTVSSVPTPIILAPGEFLDVAIQFSPSATGLREEVLLVEVSSPAADRRAVTLFGDGTP